MRLRGCGVLLLLLAGWGCSRDPNVVKQKYLQSGNRYFENGKFKEASLMYRNALKKDMRFGEAYYRLGLTELKLNRPNEAARAFTRAVELQPKSVQARDQLAELYLVAATRSPRTEYLANIESLTKELFSIDPKSARAYRLNGYLLLLRDKKFAEAIEQFRLADKLTPNKPDILLPLAQALFLDKQNGEGEKVARNAIAADRQFTPMYDLLLMYYMNGKRDSDAEALLKEKIAAMPKDPEFQVQLAQFYFGRQRPKDMESVLEKLGGNAGIPDGKLRAGDFYARIRDYQRAMRLYQDGANAEKDVERRNEYRNRMAQTLVAEGNSDGASQVVDDILKETPSDPQAQALRASLLINSGDPAKVQKAIDGLQRVVSQMPRNAPLRFNLARAYVMKGETGQAQTQLQEAIKVEPSYLPARLLLGQIHLRSREYGAVMQDAADILKIDAASPHARLLRAGALMGTGQLAEARQELEQAVRQSPNVKEPLLQLAMLDLTEKKYRDAEARLAKLNQADPNDLRALFELTEVYAAENQIEKGMQALKAALSRDPQKLQILSALANLETRAGRYDLAIPDFQTLIQLNPKSADLHLRLAETYRRKGDKQNAMEYFRKATQLAPNDVRAYLPLAILLDESGQKQPARAVYEQILKLQPENAIALNNLAYMLAETGGDLDQALTYAQRAKQRMPRDSSVADTLGWIYLRKSLTENALEIYRDLVAKSPDNPTFRYHLGMALFQKGDKAQARKELSVALQKKPPKDEESRIRELMGRLG